MIQAQAESKVGQEFAVHVAAIGAHGRQFERRWIKFQGDRREGLGCGAAQHASALGGIVDTLRAQADMMRNKVWEEARERAQKLPVKMLFPMVVGILPSIFLVTVAPSFLKLLGIFDSSSY